MVISIKSNLHTIFKKNWVEPYTKTLIKNIEKLQRKAIQEFIRAAVPLVPVLTGSAAASLLPLAQSVGASFPIIPTESRPGRGIGFGVSSQNYFWGFKDNKFILEFTTEVPWYSLWDTPPTPPPGNPSKAQVSPPWGSLDAGVEAYLRIMKEGLKDIPNVFEFVFDSSGALK